MDVRHSPTNVFFVRIDIPEIVMLFPCILFWYPIVLKPNTSNNKKTGPCWWLQPTFQKKKQLWLHLESSWIIFSPNPLRGPYTAAIGTMCYQFQGDTPGDFSRQSTKVRIHQGWTTKMNTRAFRISLSYQLLVVSSIKSCFKTVKRMGVQNPEDVKIIIPFQGWKMLVFEPCHSKNLLENSSRPTIMPLRGGREGLFRHILQFKFQRQSSANLKPLKLTTLKPLKQNRFWLLTTWMVSTTNFS